MRKDDMLDPSSSYRFTDTGQGFQRMQSAPRVGGAMHRIIAKTHRELGGWVGSKVVHLGDRDVPNALIFIDKYTQIPRMLGPIVSVVSGLDEVVTRPGLADVVRHEFGNVEGARVAILSDFFRHAFDGSGDDGGSCIVTCKAPTVGPPSLWRCGRSTRCGRSSTCSGGGVATGRCASSSRPAPRRGGRQRRCWWTPTSRGGGGGAA